MDGMMMTDFSDPDEYYAMFKEIRDRALLGDSEGLPAESFEDFSEMPLTFEEMTAGMRDDLEQVYTLTGTVNRYSADYPVLCRQLERMIKRVGSCCVTKAVLEQEGFEFPRLKDLDLKDLYCMVSFNFRKTRTAYHDSERLKGCADMGLLEQECRLVDLAERLQATEEKIRLIRDGKLKADRMLERARMFRGEKGIQRKREAGRGPLPEKGRALPVIGSVARRMIAEKRAEEKARKEMLKGGSVPGARPLPEARPFTLEEFRPSKEMLDLIRQDEEREAEQARLATERAAGKFPVPSGKKAKKHGKTQKPVRPAPMTEEEMDAAAAEAWAQVIGTPFPFAKGGKAPGRV